MKKIFSFAIVLAAVGMVSCGGNRTKPAEVVETETTEVVSACEGCTEKCDSTAACSGKCDSTACCEKAESGCCNQ